MKVQSRITCIAHGKRIEKERCALGLGELFLDRRSAELFALMRKSDAQIVAPGIEHNTTHLRCHDKHVIRLNAFLLNTRGGDENLVATKQTGSRLTQNNTTLRHRTRDAY